MINSRLMIKYASIAYLLIFSHMAFGYEVRSYEEIVNNPKNIIDYFLIFKSPKEPYITGVGDFNHLSFNDRKKLLDPNKFRSVVVDIKNAYLEIAFKEELKSKISMTYFVKKGGDKVISVSVYLAGGDCDDYFTDFFEYKNKEWISVAADVLPEINIEYFVNERMGPLNENYLDYNKIDWEFQLPRFGTAIKVQPAPAMNYALCVFDIYRDTMLQASVEKKEKIVKAYCSVIETARNTAAIFLEWDKGKGMFSRRVHYF